MASKAVLDCLNDALTHEILAISQYMDHAVRFEDQGYAVLGKELEDEAEEEMKHAERIMKRILFLGAKLEYFKHAVPEIYDDPKKMLKADYDLEAKAIKMYNDAIKVCEKAGDAGTRKLFEELLVDEEGHYDSLGTHLEQLKKHGELYLLIKG